MWHQGMLFKVEHHYVVSGGIWWQYCDRAFCGSCELDYTGALYCVTTCVTFHSGHIMVGSTVIGTVQFAVCWGPHSIAHCATVNVRCLFTIFKEGAGSGSLGVSGMFCTKQTCSSLRSEVAADDTENIIF